MRYAIVRDGVVEALVEWDGDTDKWRPLEGAAAHITPLEVFVSVGWLWNNGSPADPNPVEPAKPDNSAAEMQAQRERQMDATIEKLGVGTTTARLTVIEDGIRLLLKR